MARHLVSDTLDNLQGMIDNNQITEPYVVYITDEQRVGWNTLSGETPSEPEYLRITELDYMSDISFNLDDYEGHMSDCIQELYYRTGNTFEGVETVGPWVTLKESGNTFENFPSFTIYHNDFVEFKGVTKAFETGDAHLYIVVSGEDSHAQLTGNIQSIVDYHNMNASALNISYVEYTQGGIAHLLPLYSMFAWSSLDSIVFTIPYSNIDKDFADNSPEGDEYSAVAGMFESVNFWNTATIYCKPEPVYLGLFDDIGLDSKVFIDMDTHEPIEAL